MTVKRPLLLPLLALSMLGGLIFSAGAQAAGGSVVGWGDTSLLLGATGSMGCSVCAPSPVQLDGLSGVAQISTATDHALALRADGTVLAWGENLYGQIGDGTTNPFTALVQVKDLSDVVAVAAGEKHSLALLANGTLMAWGDNQYGELGEGTTQGPEDCFPISCSKVPVPVPGLSGVIAVGAGNRYNLALRADGTVLAWGHDFEGQIGDGGRSGGCECVDRPTPVLGVSGAVSISAGPYHGSAVLGDGTVKAWGNNYEGELGTGTVSRDPGTCGCLGPVPVNRLTVAKATAAGAYDSFAVLSNGSAQAWGYNFDGELGIGTTTTTTTTPGCHCIPSPVGIGGLSGTRAIAAGSYHSLAVLEDGTVQSWGYNSKGQLGIGSLTPSEIAAPTPVQISGASAVSANEYSSFAIVGPSQNLKVFFAGDGSGIVGTQGLLCPPSCEGRFPQGQVEILRAEGRGGAGFAGFTGPCTGTAPCQVRMDADQSVTATFGRPKGTAITKAKINRRKRTARFAFTAPGAITGYQCELIRPRPHRKPGSHKHLKRHKPRFSACANPKTYKHLVPGRYTFKVRALDILGPDATPASRAFKIKAPKPKARTPRR